MARMKLTKTSALSMSRRVPRVTAPLSLSCTGSDGTHDTDNSNKIDSNKIYRNIDDDSNNIYSDDAETNVENKDPQPHPQPKRNLKTANPQLEAKYDSDDDDDNDLKVGGKQKNDTQGGPPPAARCPRCRARPRAVPSDSMLSCSAVMSTGLVPGWRSAPAVLASA